jgi:hypothetical protein
MTTPASPTQSREKRPLGVTPIATLPPELHLQIISYLPYPDALALKHTNTYFHNITPASMSFLSSSLSGAVQIFRARNLLVPPAGLWHYKILRCVFPFSVHGISESCLWDRVSFLNSGKSTFFSF